MVGKENTEKKLNNGEGGFGGGPGPGDGWSSGPVRRMRQARGAGPTGEGLGVIPCEIPGLLPGMTSSRDSHTGQPPVTPLTASAGEASTREQH